MLIYLALLGMGKDISDVQSLMVEIYIYSIYIYPTFEQIEIIYASNSILFLLVKKKVHFPPLPQESFFKENFLFQIVPLFEFLTSRRIFPHK